MYQRLMDKTPEILDQIPKPVKKKKVGRTKTVIEPIAKGSNTLEMVNQEEFLKNK